METVEGDPDGAVDAVADLGPLASVGGPPQRPGSIGWPIQGVRCRVGGAASHGTGELEVGGSGVMAGYLGDPEATERAISPDGWLRTGDQVSIHEDGEIFYVGRLGNVINRGGEKVHPEAVERLLLGIEWVQAVAVVGLEDQVLGERVGCLVEAEPADFSSEQLERFASTALASYERPERYVRVDELPRTPTGKVRKSAAVEILTMSSDK